MADKAEVWNRRLAACSASGLSTAAFCREQGLSYAQFMYWQRRLGGRGLVPVQVEVPRTSVTALSVEVAVGAVAVRIHGARVADVVALVHGLSC
jgi:hypothetical protein